MKEYVRAAQDAELQWSLNVSRLATRPRRPRVKKVIQTIRRRGQHNVVKDWDSVPDNCVRIVGTREAERNLTKRYLDAKARQPGVVIQTYASKDEVRVRGGPWKSASPHVTQKLTKTLDEADQLIIVEKSVMRWTINRGGRNKTQFSNSQLAYIEKIPDKNLPWEKQTVTVM